MIDLHSHLLPGIDDGATDLDDALALARLAVADGIELSVVTPHVHLERYANDRMSVAEAAARFAEELERAGIALQLRAAGEVRIGPEMVEMLERDQIPFLGSLGGYRVVLLEFPHGGLPVGAERFVRWLIAQKVRPLIAHPERNRELMRDVSRIRPYLDMGCLLQVTAGSLLGQFGVAAQAAAETWLADDCVFALATDAHDLQHRRPNLGVARALLESRGQHELAARLTRTNPARLLGLAASSA